MNLPTVGLSAFKLRVAVSSTVDCEPVTVAMRPTISGFDVVVRGSRVLDMSMFAPAFLSFAFLARHPQKYHAAIFGLLMRRLLRQPRGAMLKNG